MERRAYQKCRWMPKNLGSWMGKRVVEAQQTHFEASMLISKQYMFGWDSRLTELKRELTSAVSKLALIEQLKKMLKNLRKRASPGPHVETGLTNEFKMKFPEEGDSSGSEIRYPEVGEPAVEAPQIDKPNGDFPGCRP